MKKSVQSTLVLVAICAVMAVLLALTNSITAPIIQEKMEQAANAALKEIMPDGEGFEKMDVSTYTLPATVTEVYKEANGGYVVTVTTTGYSSGLVIMVGVDAAGKVTGSKCLAHTETNTIGGVHLTDDGYGKNFLQLSLDAVEQVDTISGATKTTAAYKKAIKDALNTAIILGGGSVDLRDPAQILNDNLSAALPAGEGKFTKLFIAEVIEGIDAVYTADNGKGYVFVIGEEFIPVDESGNTDNTTVKTAYDILVASATEDIDLTAFEGLPSALTEAKKTATGHYVLTLKANGYAIVGQHFYGGVHGSDAKPMMVKVSMTSEGKIIDCVTLYENESTKYGHVVASDPLFYGQFVGMTEENLADKRVTEETRLESEDNYKVKYQLDASAGATITADGYATAVMRAFECVTIFEGGNNQ